MLITYENVDWLAAGARRALDRLSQAWPVGTRVRHVSGWVGMVAPDEPGNRLGLDVGPYAHALTGLDHRAHGAVCVAWRCEGRTELAFYRPAVLTVVSNQPARHPGGHAVPARPKSPTVRTRGRAR